MTEVEIALFPIPGSVSLPFSKVPLHVFEPRYRKMIVDSIEAKRRIGIAHTMRVLSESKVRPNAPLEEQLSSNQKTYLAYPVFSAGFAEITQTLPDGRMMVEVTMDGRYQLGEELQSIPYKIFSCTKFEDAQESTPAVDHLRRSFDRILLNLFEENAPELESHLLSHDWLTQSHYEYSFKIYSFVAIDPDLLQSVLEMKTASERIDFLKEILEKGPAV